MSDLKDRLDNLIARNGDQWLLDIIDVKFPGNEDAFFDRLNREVDSIVQELEASAVHTHEEGEEKLSNRVISLLRRAGYDAGAETEHRGHVDIIVNGGGRWTWLAECKVHSSYDTLHEGLKQLLTRYSTGRFPNGAFIIFIKNVKGSKVVEKWREKVVGEGLEYFVREQDESTRFCFRSTHEHQTSGTEYTVRHVGVMLYYSPQDKSALASAA